MTLAPGVGARRPRLWCLLRVPLPVPVRGFGESPLLRILPGRALLLSLASPSAFRRAGELARVVRPEGLCAGGTLHVSNMGGSVGHGLVLSFLRQTRTTVCLTRSREARCDRILPHCPPVATNRETCPPEGIFLIIEGREGVFAGFRARIFGTQKSG